MRSASDLINELDEERRRQGLSQMTVSLCADVPDSDVGQTYYRMWRTKNCRLSAFVTFCHALGLEIRLEKMK